MLKKGHHKERARAMVSATLLCYTVRMYNFVRETREYEMEEWKVGRRCRTGSPNGL